MSLHDPAVVDDDVDRMVAELLAEIKGTKKAILEADADRVKTFEAMKRDIAAHRDSLNRIHAQLGRPGQGHGTDANQHALAIEYLSNRAALKGNVAAGTVPEFSASEIDDAIKATEGYGYFLRTGDIHHVPEQYKASLSSFNFGSNGYLAPPEISGRILSCLTDPGDVSGLVDNVTIGSGSIKFPIDNNDGENMFGWACEADCWANGPTASLQFGEQEVKADELRGLVCLSRSFQEDAAIDLPSYIAAKAEQGFRRVLSRSILAGDGIGKPLGFLHPSAGIPICETAEATPVGQFAWQDLIALLFALPAEYAANAVFVMNRRTLGMLFTMSDGTGRPIVQQDLQEAGRWMLFGHRIVVNEYIPGVAPGNIAVAVGDFRAAYMTVMRRAVTLLPDPYSGGWCTLFKLWARVGGAILCPNAVRLLRIR